MPNLRSGKAIKKEIFEQSQNTLIECIMPDHAFIVNFCFYSKIEDKIDALEKALKNGTKLLFVWTGSGASHVFDLDEDDIKRLLDNENKDV